MRNFLIKHDRVVQRALEILPGFFSWNVILFPYWGILVIPNVVAYFILTFNIYWFYQSFQLMITALVSHFKMQASMNFNWAEEIKHFPDYNKVKNVVIIPTYKEPIHILERTLNSLATQTISGKQLIVVMAMEKKEPEEDRNEKIKSLTKTFGKNFGGLYFTVHELVPGEAIGKSSNERYAAIWVKENLINKKKLDMKYTTVTSCDADHKYHPNHFACLTYKFLDNPHRYNMFWQPAVMFYNNIWELPAITRVPNTLASMWNLSQLPRKDRLINAQNYSLSFQLLDEVDYWDPDKIPEDWGIFFKAYYKMKGKIEVEPIYLPLHADAAQSSSFWKTVKNHYEQQKRWAWGVSDDPWIIKNYFLTPGVPFLDKTMRLMWAIWSHFSWPINWFVITIGLTLPTLLNPAFGRTSLGYMVPQLSSTVLTISLIFLATVMVLETFYKPKPKNKAFLRMLLAPLELILMPVAGFFFSALPGLDAHTRLMLGKYIEYKVTEKV